MNLIIKNILTPQAAAGVELNLSVNGSYRISLAVLKKKKSTLESESLEEEMTDISSLKEFVPSEVPVHLVVTGKGIIHKKVPCTQGEEEKAILQKVLPNANINEFYVQKAFPGSNEDHSIFVSVIRKSVLDDLLQEFKTLNIEVISCSLGAFYLSSLLPFVNTATTENFELLIANHHLVFEGNNLKEYQTVENSNNLNPLLIGNDKVKQEIALSFAAAFQSFREEEATYLNVPAVTDTKEEFKNQLLFRKAGWGVLIFFLGVLLINYLVFDYFSKQVNHYNSIAFLNKDELLRYDKLKKEFSEKQLFLERTGLLEASRTSFYADQIALDLPASIQLTQLEINPVVKKMNSEETDISFVPKRINVMGTCKRSTELNEWLKMLKKKNWVQVVTLLNYSQGKTEEVGIFSIELQLN